MPPRVNKKLLMVIVGIMLVLTVGLTIWFYQRSKGHVQYEAGRQQVRDLVERGEMRKATFLLEDLVRQKPADVSARIELAKAYEQQKELPKAYTQWRTVLRYDANNLEAWHHVGKFVSDARRWGELEAAARHILELSSDSPEGLLYMAQACLGLGSDRLPDALEYGKKAVEADPKNAQTHLALAQAYLVSRDDNQVRRTIEDALVQLPDSQEIWQLLGRFEAGLARLSQAKKEPEKAEAHRLKAEEALGKALEHAENPVDGHLQLARYYFDTKNKVEAEKHFAEACKVAQTQQEKLNAHKSFGDYYAVERKWEEALKQYEEALIRWPKHREVLIKKARICLTLKKADEATLALEEVKSQGRRDLFHVQALHLNGFRLLSQSRYDEAIEELTTALTLVRSGGVPLNTSDIQLVLARAYTARGEQGTALEVLEDAHARFPRSTRVLMDLARLRYARREYSRVITLLGEDQRKPYEGHLLLARSLAARGTPEDLKTAQTKLEALRARRPKKAELHVALGRLAFRSRLDDKAIGYFNDAIKVAPKTLTAYLAKAITYERGKRFAEAEQTFRDAMAALPRNVRVRFEFARYFDRRKQFEKGEQLLLDAVAQLPEDDQLRGAYERQLPRFYLVAGKVDKAIAWYRVKAEKNPADVKTRQLIVQLALSRREFADAERYIDEIRKVQADDSPAVLLLEGQQLVTRGKYADGLAKLRIAERETPNDSDLQYYLGLCYLRTGKPKRAKVYMERVFRRFPQNPRVMRALAEVYYSLGDLTQANRLVGQLRSVGQAGWSLDVIEATAYTKTGEPERGEKVWHNIIKRNPKRSEGYMGLFDALWRQGKRTEALAALVQAHELDKKSFRTTWSLTNVYILQKDYDKAIGVALGSLEVNKDNLALLGLLARLYDLSGKDALAQETYDRIRKLDPTNPLPAVAAGDKALAKRDLPGTEIAYREALRLRPENRVVRTRLVEVLMAQKKTVAAHQVLDAALAKTPGDIGLRLIKARLFRTEGKVDEAIQEYQTAVGLTRDQNRPKDAFVIHHELGQMYLSIGRRTEARTNFELARNLRPDFLDARRQLVLLNRRERQDFEARIECLAILEVKPDLLAYVTLGDMAAEKRNWKEAKKYYDLAVKNFPGEPLPRSKRALVLMANKQHDEAITELRKALEIDRHRARSLGPLVNALVGRKQYDEALAACSEALKKNKQHVAVYGIMGEIEASRKQYDKARFYYNEALRTAQNNPHIHLAIARTYLQEKKVDLAIETAREALRRNKENPPLAVYLFLESVLAAEKRHQELRAHYVAWLNDVPGSARATNNYAWHLTEVANDPAKALREIRKCRDLWQKAGKPMPYAPQIDDTEGRVYYKLKRYREAVDLFERSLAKRPNAAKTWEHLRLAYVKLLEKARAERDTHAAYRYETEVRRAFEKVREHSPMSFESQVQLGDMKLADGRFKEAIEAYESALQLKKDDTSVQRKLAELLIRDGRTERAKPLVLGLVANEPDVPQNAILEGFLYSRQGESKKAVAVLEKVTAKHPDVLMGHYILAQEYIGQNQIDKANASLEKAIKLDPKFLGARLIKARLLALTRKVDEAITEFERIVKDAPTSFDASYEMGNLLMYQKRLPEAVSVFKGMKTKWPNSVLAQERLALAYQLGNQTGKSLLEYRDARRRNPDSLRIVRGLVSVLQKQGKFEEAVTEYRKYVDDNPRSAGAWLDLGGLYSSRERWDDVERSINAAVRVAPNSVEVRRALSRFYMSRKQYDKARLTGKRMVMDLPTSMGRAIGYTTIAQGWEREGKIDEAIREYKNAIKEDKNHVEAVNNLGWLLVTRKQEYAEAIRLTEPYLKTHGGFPELLDTLGWAYLKNGEAKKAEPLLGRAVQLQSARDRRVMAEIAYHYGEALYRNGKLKDAKKVLEQLSKLKFSESERVKEILSKIK